MSDIKSYIDDKLSDLSVSEDLSIAILKQTMNNKAKKQLRFTARRMVASAAVICLILTCSMTAFAATVPGFNDWIYKITPELAELLYPVNKSTVDNGIKVEVLSAVNDNHNAAVYFTVRDTTDEGRVNEKLDLCDTYYIDGPCIFHVQMLSYDEETNTTFFVMRGSGGEGMSDQMTTFKISELMSNKVKYEWYNTQIDLTGLIDGNAKSLPISEFYYAGGSDLSVEKLSVLEPDVMSIPFGDDIDFVTISNIGFVDGKLHIQTKWETSFDNHGELWITDEKGVINGEANTVSYNNYYFNTAEDSANSSIDRFAHHIEYVFDIGSIEELSGHNLWASFVEDGTFTEGEWKVNFRLSDSDKIYIDKTASIADSVEVTAIGAYVNGYTGNRNDCDLSIVMKDGTALNHSQFSKDDQKSDSSNRWDISMMFDAAIHIKDIASISIDGIAVYKAQ